MIWDIAIAGGGPAGLALAIRAAQAGLRAVVLERSAEIPDKACGEGLMPSGVRELRKLGAEIDGGIEFRGIRYLQENGHVVEARFAGIPASASAAPFSPPVCGSEPVRRVQIAGTVRFFRRNRPSIAVAWARRSARKRVSDSSSLDAKSLIN